MEVPPTTPMSRARAAAGKSLDELTLDLVGADGNRNWNEKTVANLEHGGPAHPTFQAIHAAASVLHPHDQLALPRWRRWYGLRHLARQFAKTWCWEWLGGCLTTTLTHAHAQSQAMRESDLAQEQRRTVTSIGLFAGWRLGFARWAFGEVARAPENDIHPVIRADYAAISRSEESSRLTTCLQLATGARSLEATLLDHGRSASAARREASQLIWNFQGNQSQFRHLHPLAELFHSRNERNWPAMEAAAGKLVEQRPDLSDNHRVLAEALADQNHFEDALSVTRDALTRFPADGGLAMTEIAVLMMRGDHHTDRHDFEVARDKLLAMQLTDDDWVQHLHLADCHLALGAWAAARDACRRVIATNGQCGEAHAILSFCRSKLGDDPRNTAAKAARRGEQGFVDLLHELDRRGELGTAAHPPVARWHRLWRFRR
ncbi:MAG: hypothetical protein WAT39_12920 [Planctomycetota bacterium]